MNAASERRLRYLRLRTEGATRYEAAYALRLNPLGTHVLQLERWYAAWQAGQVTL